MGNFKIHNILFYSQMLINLLGLPVALEESPQHPHTAHPDDLLGHTSISSTLPLTSASVTTFPASNGILATTGTGVHSNRFPDDQTILDQLTDILS